MKEDFEPGSTASTRYRHIRNWRNTFAACIFLPEQSFKIIDSVPIKYVLFVLCWLLAVTITAIVWYYFYLPRGLRIVVGAQRLIAGIMIVSTGGSILGYPRLTSIEFDPASATPVLQIHWEEVIGASALVLAISLVGFLIATWLYLYVLQFERIYGPLTPR